MSRARSHIRPPMEYSSADFGKIIDRIYDDINNAASGVYNDVIRNINRSATRDVQSAPPVVVNPQIRFNQVGIAVSGDVVEWGRFRLWFESGASMIRDVEFRFAGGEIDDATVSWISLNGTDYNSSPATGTVGGLSYKGGQIEEPGVGQGFYWQAEARIPIKEFGNVLAMQVRCLGEGGVEYGSWSYEFDADRLPRIADIGVSWGIWNTGSNQYPLRLSVNADEDTGSLAYYVTTSDYGPDEVEEISDTNFTLLVNDRSAKDQQIGLFDPSAIGGPATTYYVLVRGYSKTNKGVVSGEDPGLTTKMITIQSLDDPRDPQRINPLSIDSSQLVAVAQNVSVRLSTARSDYRTFNTTGSIVYADNTTLTITGGSVTLPPVGGSVVDEYAPWYAYVDPAAWTSDINYGANSAAAQVQFTQDSSKAKAEGTTGRRRFIGIAKKSQNTAELVFVVMTGEEPIITAPIIQVIDLYALQATIGGWNIGASYITDGGSTGMSSETGGSPNLRFWAGSASYALRNDASTPFRVYDDGSVVATSITLTGYVNTFRQSSDPSPPTAKNVGDLWTNTNTVDFGGYLALSTYRWTGSAWEIAATQDSGWRQSGTTQIDGGNIYAGTIIADAFLDTPSITMTGTIAERGTTQAGGVRPGSTDALQIGDTWFDTDGTTEVWTWNGSAFVQRITIVSGDKITTGTIQSANWSTTLGSQINLTTGTIYMGGSSSPAFSWDGSSLVIDGQINVSGVKLGRDVNAVGDYGIWIDSNNYFYADTAPGPSVGLFRVGGASEYVLWNGSSLVVAGDLLNSSGTTIFDASTTTIGNNANLANLTITGTLTINPGKIVATDGTYTMTIDQSFIDIDYPTVFNVNLSTGGLSVNKYLPTIEASGASYGPGVASLSGVGSLTYFSVAASGGQTTKLYADTLTSTSNFTITTSSGLLNLNPTGDLYLKNVAYPSYSTGYLYYNGSTLSWASVAGGATTFLGLTDTPASFAGSGGYLVRVNGSASALEFVDGGTIYQPLDAQLTQIAGLTPVGGNLIYGTGGAFVSLGGGSAGQFLEFVAPGVPQWSSLTESDISDLGTNIVLNSDIGSTVQAYNAHLLNIAALGQVTGADYFMVSSAANTWTYETPAQVRTTLGLVIGSNVQAHDAVLDSLSGVSPSANSLFGHHTGPGAAVMYTLGSGLAFTAGSPYKLELDIAGATAGSAADWYNGYTLYETTGGVIKRITVGLPLGSIASLSSPGADRIMFWDNSAGAMKWLSLADGLSISSTTLSADVRVSSSELQFSELPGTDATARTFSTYMRARIGSTAYYIPLYT